MNHKNLIFLQRSKHNYISIYFDSLKLLDVVQEWSFAYAMEKDQGQYGHFAYLMANKKIAYYELVKNLVLFLTLLIQRATISLIDFIIETLFLAAHICGEQIELRCALLYAFL